MNQDEIEARAAVGTYGPGYVTERLKWALGEIDSLRTQLKESEEWKLSVLSAVKTIPEHTSGQWAGDKEGWGFVFELINWLQRSKKDSEEARERLRGALLNITKCRASHALFRDSVELAEDALKADAEKNNG